MIYFILILMVFFHIIDDFYLQGVLASMKQKIWWKNNASDKKYKYDYIVALIMHSISWSIMIMLPPIFFNILWYNYYYSFIILGTNVVLHSIVDDLKANKLKINLIVDQVIHILQIVVTWIILIKFCI